MPEPLSRDTTMTEWQTSCFLCSLKHGWWDGCFKDKQLSKELVSATIPEKVALIQSEFDEAFEAFETYPTLPYYDFEGKPEGWGIELIDVLIRIFDLAGALGINLSSQISSRCAITSSPTANASIQVMAESSFYTLFYEMKINNFQEIANNGYTTYQVSKLRVTVSYVLEAYRKGDDDKISKAIVELALHMLAYLYAMLSGEVKFVDLLIIKHNYNLSRPYRHGGLRA